MKIKFVYGILPALVFYTDSLPVGTGGEARGPVVRIRKKYEGTDSGILAHELTHVKQFYRCGLVLHSLRYRFSKAYRLWAEVQAYREQLKHYTDDRKKAFALYIVTGYDLFNLTAASSVDDINPQFNVVQYMLTSGVVLYEGEFYAEA